MPIELETSAILSAPCHFGREWLTDLTAIQGLGSGGSMSVTDIIFADMVPLPERGKFQGIAAAYVSRLLRGYNALTCRILHRTWALARCV